MLRYAIYRLLWLVPTLLAMALVTFLVMHATPGSPLDPVAEGANPLSPEAQKNLAEAYGLDKPLWKQFAIFVAKVVQGDFGQSFVYKTRSVLEIMTETFPISLFLGAMALDTTNNRAYFALGLFSRRHLAPVRRPVWHFRHHSRLNHRKESNEIHRPYRGGARRCAAGSCLIVMAPGNPEEKPAQDTDHAAEPGPASRCPAAMRHPVTWIRKARPDRQRLAFIYQLLRQILSGRQIFDLTSRVTFGEILAGNHHDHVLAEVERAACRTLEKHMAWKRV